MPFSLVAAVVLSSYWLAWAGQLNPVNTIRSARVVATPRADTARSTPTKSAKRSAQRKAKTSTLEASELAEGKRDPFKIPELSIEKVAGETILESAPPGGVLPTGKRGLLISHLTLQGVVREQTSNKMIAVVTNETKVARFLYENDSLYNGVVSKITPDAVYFKENVLDSNGRVTTREVVKRLGSAPGEGR
jgi:hypothetical protein